MGDWSSDEAGVDVDVRLLDDMGEELRVTHQRLASALSDVQEVTNTAMDIARRLDECEKSLVGTLDELEELEAVRGVEVQELRSLMSDQSETIARQAAYINRLRTQIRHPFRIIAKRVLGPFTSIMRRDGHQ